MLLFHYLKGSLCQSHSKKVPESRSFNDWINVREYAGLKRVVLYKHFDLQLSDSDNILVKARLLKRQLQE